MASITRATVPAERQRLACAHLGDLGARTLIHPALKLRTYDVILSGQDGVAGLGSPRRHRDRGAHGVLGELLLRVRKKLSLRRRDIGRIGFTEFRWRDEEILVRSGAIFCRPHGVVWRGELRQKLATGLLHIRLECGYIPAPAADPWSARGAALRCRARHALGSMGERALEPHASQCCDRRLRQ